MQIYVPLQQISDNPYQRRVEYGDLDDLAARIHTKHRDYPDTYGLLQVPIGRLLMDGQVVAADIARRLLEANGPGWPAASCAIQLAFGHRRLRAFRLLAEQHPADYPGTMPVNVLYLTDDQMLDACWSENRERRDLSAVEEAELLAEKLERARAEGGSQETVAQAWGLSRSTIANRIRLLDLPAEVQQANRDGRLSERQALALLPVIELEQKLNGSPVKWADTGGEAWGQRSPAGYIAQVVANPDAATSDDIRQYTQNALRHAGRPLGDDFAAFEAGQGPDIVQSACKGCPRRYNQSCLDPRCHNARSVRFRAVLPEWASRETGLPFSDKAADETDFTHTYDEREAIRQAWHDGRHDDLVVGIQNEYYNLRPYSDKGYAGEEADLLDWRSALILGRRRPRAEAAEESTAAGDQPSRTRPTNDDLALWRKQQTKADRERSARVKQFMRGQIQPLAADETALRALVALLDGYNVRQFLERGESPTVESLIDGLFDLAWKRGETNGNFDDTHGNRAALRRLLHVAAFSPDCADPAEPTLRLLDIGQVALLTYEEQRNRIGPDYARRRLNRIRDAVTDFDAAPNIVAGNAELEQLAAYLRAAADREEKLLAEKLPEE